MLATLEKHDIETLDSDAPKNHSRGAQSIDLPDEVQASLDRILAYYRNNTLKPVINACGDPLTICATLANQVRQNLPLSMEDDAKYFLDYMIGQIVVFCREHKANSLTLDFSFERESYRGAS